MSTMSLTVNALVTGLVVFRIFKVFRHVKTGGAIDGSKLRRIIFILIESGMALISVQFIRLVVTIVWTDAAVKTFSIIIPIHQIPFNGITPIIILVRIQGDFISTTENLRKKLSYNYNPRSHAQH